jgi:hypothetical protein
MARARPSSPLDPLDRLMGEAPALQTLRARIRHLASFDAVGHAAVLTVLLQGETGTGKGLLAWVIHDSGPRAHGPFIEVNCAAIPETLLEAALFGVEAGAFTDAKRAKPGLFEAASGGTLFLDEIAALPLSLQGKCLTAIETKRVRRVGAVVEQPMDVKLIAATQVELSGHVQAGRFRADLYHRLAVVVLELPPLRLRGEDILVLAIEATWPERSEAAAGHYEPWTVASRWEQRVAEKVAGFGGVILQGSTSLLLVAFGLPRTLEQLPQRAIHAALAIRHLAAEAPSIVGQAVGPVVRLAGHLGTLLVAEETGDSPGRWLAIGETLSLPVRLLGHATPGEVLVSAPMARLIDGWVEVQTRPLSSGAEPSDRSWPSPKRRYRSAWPPSRAWSCSTSSRPPRSQR